MWNSYFFQIQSKYSMRVSFKNPLVIRLDGKDVTKNKKYDLLNNYEGNFRNTLEKTAEFFTKKYKCLAILGSDEISFIFTDPLVVISDLDKEKWNTSNEIISVFSQYFFDYFNEHNKQSKVFWHGKCFSIRNEKINSYIKFRSSIIKNVMTTYFLSKYNIKMGKEKQEKREIECKKLQGYEVLEDIQNGVLYLEGDRIDIIEFYKGNIKKVKSTEHKSSDLYIDLTNF
ncbi:MAG: tRNA(His) guanylyltransferase Thg1 family protein [Clostridia bacterium]|jgi:tRNA(His) 5'-end guanylyltransferase|nr:unknown [Clostridium sp. CAG:245]